MQLLSIKRFIVMFQELQRISPFSRVLWESSKKFNLNLWKFHAKKASKRPKNSRDPLKVCEKIAQSYKRKVYSDAIVWDLHKIHKFMQFSRGFSSTKAPISTLNIFTRLKHQKCCKKQYSKTTNSTIKQKPRKILHSEQFSMFSARFLKLCDCWLNTSISLLAG